MKVAAELQAVRADHFREHVLHLVSIVVLPDRVRGNTDAEIVKVYVWDAFECRINRSDSSIKRASRRRRVGRAIWHRESERTERRTDSTLRTKQVYGVSGIAQVKLIHTSGTESFVIAEIDQLRAPR